MKMITRLDESGKTLLWCGDSSFNIISAQTRLNQSGLQILKMREDKWAELGSLRNQNSSESGE